MLQTEKIKEILVFGAGYVGLSNAAALSNNANVSLYDKNKERIDNLKRGVVDIDDISMQKHINEFKITFLDAINNLKKYDLFILALPTNYNNETEELDTIYLDNQIKEIRKYSNSIILIKSTIPVGYTNRMSKIFGDIIFSPEFLREGTSLFDVQHPARIIFGWDNEVKWVKNLFVNSVLNNPEFFNLKPNEAETVKLFSNSYLATRVAFVNEVDSFAQKNNMNSTGLIKAITADPRIGNHYFEPSSGYGGYCLPKDTKQLISEFKKVDLTTHVIEGVDQANEIRINDLVKIAKMNDERVVINGIGHKPNVNNYRNSRNLKLAQACIDADVEVEIIDKNYQGQTINGIKIK